jgi:hypothetical protein
LKELNRNKEQQESAGIVLDNNEREVLYTQIKNATTVELTGDQNVDEKLVDQQYQVT